MLQNLLESAEISGALQIDGIAIAMFVIAGLIAVMGIVSAIVSIYLAISYIKYNRTKASCGKAGKDIARDVLDANGLTHIKVSSTGSIMFGNSYSHYFKKVRLRRLTWKKSSVTSLAMATQKASLAVLDKENDPDMNKRITLTPLIYFGPIAFIPLVLVGIVLDILIFNTVGVITLVLAIIGLLFYVLSFVMSVLVLKTEKKAQAKAIEIMQNQGLASVEEVQMCKELFRLYNIQYINDMIIALLELIYRILQLVAQIKGDSSLSKN